MASSIARCIDNVRPKTVAPVKEWTVRNCVVQNLTQVRNLNFEKWKLNQGQFLQLNMFVSVELHSCVADILNIGICNYHI